MIFFNSLEDKKHQKFIFQLAFKNILDIVSSMGYFLIDNTFSAADIRYKC